MFSIGFSELIVIIVLAIILFKPNDWIDIVKNLKKYISNFRQFSHNTKKEIFDLTQLNELKDNITEIKDEILDINGKKYIYGEDGQLYETFSLEEIKADITHKKDNIH